MKRPSISCLRANSAPSKLPLTISAVARVTASAQGLATTVTDAGGAGIDSVDPVAAIARRRHGGVLKSQNGMGRTALRIGRFHRNRPWLSVKRQP